MADYYSLLAKALANLPNKSLPSARRAIYDRARKALIGQLRTLEPALAEADVKREETALDAAIQRLETQFASPAAAPVKPSAEPTAKPPAPPSPNPAPSTPSEGAHAPPPSGAPPASGPVLAPPRAPTQSPPVRPTPVSTPPLQSRPIQPVAPKSAQPPAVPPATPAKSDTPHVEAAPPTAPTMAAAPSPVPPLVALSQSHAVDDRFAPPVGPPPTAEPLLPPPIRAGNGAARPNAPGHNEKPRRDAWPFVVMAILLGLAGAVAIVAIQLRQKPQDLAIHEPEATTETPAPGAQNKVVQRVPADGSGTPGAQPPVTTPSPAVSNNPSPESLASQTPAPSSTPSPESSSDAAKPPGVAATPTPSENATPQAAAPLAVAARAAMLVAVASDPQKPAINLGTVVWSLVPAGTGAGALPTVRAEVDIPDAKMRAVMTIQKNTLASLPASHTIDLRLTFADGADIKGIKDMALPQLRRDDPPGADAVTGARAKINDNYYLVGLTKTDADSAHNLDLLATHNWFDFPLLLNDDRIAKLTFEKSNEGDRVIQQALAAWK